MTERGCSNSCRGECKAFTLVLDKGANPNRYDNSGKCYLKYSTDWIVKQGKHEANMVSVDNDRLLDANGLKNGPCPKKSKSF